MLNTQPPTPTRALKRSPSSEAATVALRARVPSLARGLAMLDLLARRREAMGLARLAAELSLPKSSVHGLCNTMLACGYLRRLDNGSFRLGPRVMSLAEAFVAETDVVAEFNRLWQDHQPEETVILSVLEGKDVLYLAARNGSQPLGLAFSVGMRLPAHLAATGKALLAFDATARVRERLGGALLPAMNPARRPQRLPALLKELAATRERGYSVDDEGVRAGVYCIGAAVFDSARHPVAAVSICLNKARLDNASLQRHLATVRPRHCTALTLLP